MKKLLAAVTVLAVSTIHIDAGNVVPNGLEESPGDLRNRAPFALFGSRSVPRYQQIYGAPDLTTLLGLDIVGIAFRMDESPGFNGDVAGGFIYDNLEIRLSTSPRSVDGLSVDLDSNVGPDEAVVYDGPFALPDLEGNLPVNPFDLLIVFSNPFRYTGGNLLIDVFVPDDTPPFFYLDAQWLGGSPTDQVSRAYILNASDVVDTLGLVTQFLAISDDGCLASPARRSSVTPTA